ncbi:hypothetical protein [Paenibacillus oleatilyticus]|uniref:hypothetical protein n=1 Tax=Paenibacillus oleatilyticus TaxID=2594886 RepID=UPI001C1F72EF|nr:hypothetical protein [Paenibacillus oleatilyticus]MBU7316687.1 hypothetical protein [Paenibacillus oleatilyticus]
MQPERPPDDHRRFLKQHAEEYKLGTYFPEKLTLLAKSEPVSFQWLRETEHGSVVFLMSASCSACSMAPVQEFTERFEAFRYCVLFEGSEEAMEQQREIYDLDMPFYLCDTVKLHSQLKVGIVPYALILNKLGQAVGADIFNDCEKLERLAAPLIRVYERSLAQV